MEEVIKREPVYKQVKSGTKEVHVWVAPDGQEFGDKKSCLSYENALKDREIEKTIHAVSAYFSDYPYLWYYPVTEEQLEFVKRRVGFNSTGRVYINCVRKSNVAQAFPEIKLCQWIGGTYDEDGDDFSAHNIYTLDYVKLEIEKKYKEFIESFVIDLSCS